MPGRLLGDLPRSRPGTRSAKRGPGTATPPPPADAPEQAEAAPGDAVSAVLGGAGRLAGLGLRTTGKVAVEIARRMPRL